VIAGLVISLVLLASVLAAWYDTYERLNVERIKVAKLEQAAKVELNEERVKQMMEEVLRGSIQ